MHGPESREGQRGPGNPEVSGEALASPGTGAGPSLEANAAVEEEEPSPESQEGQHAPESHEGEHGPEAKGDSGEALLSPGTGAGPSLAANTAVEKEIHVEEPDSGVPEVHLEEPDSGVPEVKPGGTAVAREPASRVSPAAAAREPTKCFPWPCHL